ncbi:MAG: glutamate--tRNA ligase [Candidatus Nomurabacteria bacterium]|jgi:glutamyl-tRNA synthetase|nr:glutamate--tRNA ligase [Candidatus Nomurabacteria bacterium]
MSQEIRTRFAPSPTGYVHVGNIRTALFAYLVARAAGGKFILRIEDTDRNRFVPDAEKMVLDTLTWLGLEWDEGPTLDGGEAGPYAPYHQTARKTIYKKWADKLIAAGRAYADPYTPRQIQEFRDLATHNKQPFLYRDHRPTTTEPWDGSTPLRFKSEPKSHAWHDAIMGDLSAGAEAVDDFILIKSDGLPTYNFAHIVDDCEMKITHVIRGQEFISSMPNYLNLYEALGEEPPIFAHMPHILNSIGNKKLGKRDGAKSITDYRDDGFLPEAMLNFLASLGWNDGTEQEIFSLDELVAKFDLSRVGRSGARFDEKRLVWLNGQWVKRLSLDELYVRAAEFWGEHSRAAGDDERRKVLAVVQERLKTLADLPSLTEYFFARPTPDWTMVDDNKQLGKIPRDELLELLKIARNALAEMAITDWTEEILQSKLNELLETTGSKPAILFSIIRYALTWAAFSPGLPETMALLGREETLARLSSTAPNDV